MKTSTSVGVALLVVGVRLFVVVVVLGVVTAGDVVEGLFPPPPAVIVTPEETTAVQWRSVQHFCSPFTKTQMFPGVQ